jgi:predicted metal-dependent enzyme (double-stranded beta helix superfamily)
MSTFSRRTFLTSTAGLMAASACSTPSGPWAADAPSKFELARFLADLQHARPHGQKAVEAVIARAVSDPESVVRELGQPDRRAATLLHQGDGLSVYNIVWQPHAIVAAHDHLTWATIGVYAGSEDNVMWKRSNGVLERHGAASVQTGEVFSLPDDAIHSVTNPGESCTAALHVYGADLSTMKRG